MILLALLAAASCDDALRQAGEAFHRQLWDLSIASFRQALLDCPPRVEIHESFARVLFVAGKLDQAEEQLKKSLAIDSRHVPSLYSLGRLYYEQHRYAESVEALERVVSLDARNYRAWDNLGLAYDALRKDSDALRSFFKALDLVMKDHREYDWAHANLADFFLKRDEYEKAFQLAAEAARRNPRSARNAFLTGKALARLDRTELSLRWLEQAVKLDPGHAESWYAAAQQYRKLGRAAEAARALEKFRAANQARPQRR